MENAVILSAVLRRASPLTRRRAIIILFALRHWAKKSGTTPSLELVTTALEFSMSGRPVRFVFATGGHASLLRSHDRGSTWRIVYRANGTTKCHDNEEKVPGADDSVLTMEDIAMFLSPSQEQKEEESDRKKKKKRQKNSINECSASELSAQLSHVTTWSSMVAVCGNNVFLAVSVDRGMTFAHVEEEVIHPFMKYEPNTSGESCKVEGLAFLSGKLLLFFFKNYLFSIELIYQERLGVVTFSQVSLIEKFATPIGCMRTFCKNGKDDCELFVSTKGFLHYSYNGGRSFLTFPHKLGIIRALQPLDMTLRRCEIPQLPKELIMPMLSTAVVAAEEDASKNSKPEKYAYRAISPYLSSNHSDADGERANNEWVVADALPHCYESGQYRVLLVGGTGTPILTYDYTALLFIAATLNESTGCPGLLGSLAERVEYMPYVRSGAAEPISISVSRRPGSKVCVFTRSNASGVCLSTDMGKSWTTPTQAYTVALIAMDGCEFICCNRRNVVSIITSSGSEFHTVPSDLRVPFLTDAAVML